MSPLAPLGIPKTKLNIFEVSSPEASTVTVGSTFGSSCVAEAVGVPNPAGEPVLPIGPCAPCGPCAPISPFGPFNAANCSSVKSA